MTSERTGSPETVSLDVSVQPGPIVTIGGEIDIQSGPQLRDQLLSIIRRYGARLALDLTGVTFIDCAGINVLLAARRRAQLEGGSLRVLWASPRVQRVIALTRLQHVLMATALPDAAASRGSIGLPSGPEGDLPRHLRPVGDAELLMDLAQVVVHSGRADEQLGRDLAIGVPAGDKAHDLLLLQHGAAT